MATIIPLHHPSGPATPLSRHIEAGWILVYTTLWQHDALPKQEIAYARQIIRQTLGEGPTLPGG